MSDDLVANLNAISESVRDLGSGTEELESAIIVGAARAVQDLGDPNVVVCVRLREPDETEFQIRSDGDNGIYQWMTIDEFELLARGARR